MTTNEVLAKIFSQSPLPNRLKTRKQRWLRGKLKETAICSLIREYSDYSTRIEVEKKEYVSNCCSSSIIESEDQITYFCGDCKDACDRVETE